MKNFKDKLISISKAKNEKDLKLQENKINEQFNIIMQYAINHLSWLNNNYQSELEIAANNGSTHWNQIILGKPLTEKKDANFNTRNYEILKIKSFQQDKFEKGIRKSIEFKSLKEKFHKSGLVLNLKSDSMHVPSEGTCYFFALETYWDI